MLKNYKIGLSLIGIAAVVLIMVPNIIYLFATLPNDVLSTNEAGYWLWNTFENIGRFGSMITLCIVVRKNAALKNSILNAASICSLLLYYSLWIAYFKGIFNGLSLVGLAFFPTVFFLLISWKLKNAITFSFSLLFAIVHIAITGSNYLFMSF